MARDDQRSVGRAPACQLRRTAAILAVLACAALAAGPRAEASGTVRASLGRVPLHFEPNVGQSSSAVRFLARAQGYTAFVTDGAIVLDLQAREGQAEGHGTVRLVLEGAFEGRFVPVEPLPGRSHYFTGKDPALWRKDVPHFGGVRYEGVYPGIDLVLRPNGRRLRYDFEVAPGADPGRIRIRAEGAEATSTQDGNLVHVTASGARLVHRDLVATSAGETPAVSFRLDEEGRFGFRVERWSGREKLVIDPTLVFATLVGGDGFDAAHAIAVNSSPLGDTYVVGETGSADFPRAGSPYDSSHGGQTDAFVARLEEDFGLVSMTFLGGTGNEAASGVALDGSGAVYVTGQTNSALFPATAGAFDATHNGSDDVFVAKLSAGLDALVYSTFLGGSGREWGADVDVDSGGSAVVTGGTTSTGFPTAGSPHDTTHNGSTDAFVTRLNAAGSALVWSTFLGGASGDEGTAVDVEPISGLAYVGGSTASSGFPATAGALDTSFNGVEDGFVAKLTATGTLSYATFVGGAGRDRLLDVRATASGQAYAAGSTQSADFPATAGAHDTALGGGADAFVARLSASGSSLLFATYLGGAGADGGEGLAVDAAGLVHVTGTAGDGTFPVTPGAADTTFGGGTDAFVAAVAADGSALSYSTYLGGDGDDAGHDLALDESGRPRVAGATASSSFTPASMTLGNPNGYSVDGFVSWLAAGGGSLAAVVFVGGTGDDEGWAVASDTSGNVYLTGAARSAFFPSTAGSWDTSLGGRLDAFVTKLGPSGSLLYSTFLGGSSFDAGQAVAVDAAGNAYVGGYSWSAEFPTTSGAYDTTLDTLQDGFVAKLGPTGSTLVYSTFLGGTTNRSVHGLAVDAGGGALVAGSVVEATGSSTDVLVARLAPAGSFLSYSTLLGGGSKDAGLAIAVGGDGSAYVTGETQSSDFTPITPGAFDATHNGGVDAFVTKLNASGVAVYSTFLGGGSTDVGRGIAVDGSGRAFVAGETSSADFPTTAGALDTTLGGSQDAFVARLSAGGGSLEFSTFLGGETADGARGVAVDGSGAAYTTGSAGAGFPVTPDAFDTTHNGETDAFLAKLAPGGGALAYGTYLGGSELDYGRAIALDASGHAVATGLTSSSDFPGTAGTHDPSWDGGFDAFVARLSLWACTSFTIAPASAAPASAAGSTPVDVVGAPAGCVGQAWSASANAPWLAVTPEGGSGSIPVTVSWQANTGPARTGTVTIAGSTFTVDQAAPLCTSFSITPTAVSPTASAGSTPVDVVGSPAGCAGGSWTATPNDTWLSTNLTGGTGPGSITVSWQANPGSSRTGTVTIATRTFTVSQGASGGASVRFFTLTPCRVVDTRNAPGTLSGPSLAAGETRSWPVVSGSCGVPAGAQALAVNVTAVAPPAPGYLTLWPSGTAMPLASTLNYKAGAVRANNALVKVSGDGQVSVSAFNGSPGPVDVVLDVSGYFAPSP
ncbi:hypothetical protein FBQ97_01150 [Acidobacteria bacterium ACD]|nr:MAG: hypothetical protein EDX89_14110 [Acidobacteriota bacterium]MDL1948407.1 hypothetical protein [Acidobacteria bacterium ACD]